MEKRRKKKRDFVTQPNSAPSPSIPLSSAFSLSFSFGFSSFLGASAAAVGAAAGAAAAGAGSAKVRRPCGLLGGARPPGELLKALTIQPSARYGERALPGESRAAAEQE